MISSQCNTNDWTLRAAQCVKDGLATQLQDLICFVIVVSSLIQCQFSRQIISDPMPEDVFLIFFKDMRHFTFQEGLLWFVLVVSSLVQCQFSRQIISDPMPEDVFFNILQGHEAFYFSRGSTMVYPCSFQLGPMPVPQQYNFRPHARRFFLIFFKDMRHFTFQEGLLWFILVVSNLVQCQFPSNIISDPM